MRVFVSTANVNSNDSPVAAPNPIGGSQANTAAFGAYTGYAVLVNNESATDGNAAGGAFPAVIATDSGPGSTGIVPIAEVLINNGTGSAIWEVVNTNPNTIENFKFAVYTTYTANPAQSSPPDATTVNLSFAPSSATGDAGDSGIPLPRFAPPSGSALPVFNLCTTSSCLTIANTHTGSFMQGQVRRHLHRGGLQPGRGKPDERNRDGYGDRAFGTDAGLDVGDRVGVHRPMSVRGATRWRAEPAIRPSSSP